MTAIGSALKELRRERNLSLRDVAVVLGVSPESVQHYETGRGTWATTLRYAAVVDAAVILLKNGKPVTRPGEPIGQQLRLIRLELGRPSTSFSGLGVDIIERLEATSPKARTMNLELYCELLSSATATYRIVALPLLGTPRS